MVVGKRNRFDGKRVVMLNLVDIVWVPDIVDLEQAGRLSNGHEQTVRVEVQGSHLVRHRDLGDAGTLPEIPGLDDSVDSSNRHDLLKLFVERNDIIFRAHFALKAGEELSFI